VEAKSTKKRLLDAIVSEIEDVGMKQVTSQMKLIQLAHLTAPLKIDHGTNNPTKTVLRKRFIEKMEELGLDKFLSKSTMTSELLSMLIQAADEQPLSKDKDKLIFQATEIINLVGFQSFFSRFDIPFLQHLLSEMDLKCNTDSKDRIVYALATQTNAKKQKIEHKEIIYSDEKQPIKKGVTYQDIYQYYFREELVDWSKNNGLKVTGSKKELIQRILAFLDGNKENTMSIANRKEEDKKDKKVEKESKKVNTKDANKKQKEEVTDEEESEEEVAPPKKEDKKKKIASKDKKPAKEDSEEEEE